MADQFETDEERTETPTAHRREEFRKQGKVAFSKEILSAFIFLGMSGAFVVFGKSLQGSFAKLRDIWFHFDRTGDWTREHLYDLSIQTMKIAGSISLPFLLTSIVIALVGSVAQVGFFVTYDPLTPDIQRLNPIKGLGRIFSWNGVFEAFKALIKLGLILGILWLFLSKHAQSVGFLMNKDIHESIPEMFLLGIKLLVILGLSILVLAGLDYFFQRYRLEQQMKMTKKEIKEEFKLREGDPFIRARIRNVQKKIASRRMLEAVPKADVVVTNPTHFAVALQYTPQEMAAPKVVAKGVDFMAQKIKEIALKNGVPCVENRPLARSLYKEVEVGHTVSRELYKAVAQVLSYVYRLKQRSLESIT